MQQKLNIKRNPNKKTKRLQCHQKVNLMKVSDYEALFMSTTVLVQTPNHKSLMNVPQSQLPDIGWFSLFRPHSGLGGDILIQTSLL